MSLLEADAVKKQSNPLMDRSDYNGSWTIYLC